MSDEAHDTRTAVELTGVAAAIPLNAGLSSLPVVADLTTLFSSVLPSLSLARTAKKYSVSGARAVKTQYVSPVTTTAGIDANRAIVLTFAIGAAMAGAAGVLYGLKFRQVFFFVGFLPGIKAFTAAVLGGIGNVPGAMLGGLFLGIIESVGPTLFLDGLSVPSPNQLTDAIAFTMLILVLIFRPAGILGERVVRSRA